MDFLKKNYEKVLLGLVLAGLIGALVFMLFFISGDRQAMEERSNGVLNPSVKALTNLDLTIENNSVSRLRSPAVLDFEFGHKVFNPMEWQKGLDGLPIKVSKVGPQVCVVTNIVPLYLIVSLDLVTTNELGARYTLGVEKQAAATVGKRRKQQRFVSVGEKPNDFFSLVEVKGAPENPDALVVKLVDSGETVMVSRDKAFRRVDAHAVDFRYDPERKTFRGRRVGDKVSFGGTDYLVADVGQSEMILTDQSNQKKTSLPFAP